MTHRTYLLPLVLALLLLLSLTACGEQNEIRVALEALYRLEQERGQ